MNLRSTGRAAISALIEAMRPHHWVKNFLVFLPIIASQQFSMSIFVAAINAFFSFSLLASAVYVLNDLHDAEFDRSHERKKNRPIASGRLSKQYSVFLVVALLFASGYFALMLSGEFWFVIVVYFLLAISYTWKLKPLIYVDVIFLASFYCFRIIAGGVATGIQLSNWLLLFSACIFLSLAFVKRQAELVNTGTKETDWKIKGRGYSKRDLPALSMLGYVTGSASVLVLAFYIGSPIVTQIYKTPVFLWLICPILALWLFHIFNSTIHGEMHDDPIVFATTDLRSLLGLLSICVVVGLAIFA